MLRPRTSGFNEPERGGDSTSRAPLLRVTSADSPEEWCESRSGLVRRADRARFRDRRRVGDEVRDVGPGTVLLIPRGTVHAIEVTAGPSEAVSAFSSPFDGKDRFFVE